MVGVNHKRRKSKRNVRCTLCTPFRWRGNGKGRFKLVRTINIEYYMTAGYAYLNSSTFNS